MLCIISHPGGIPLSYSTHIGLHVLHRVTRQLLYDSLVVAVSGRLQHHLHDLTLHVLIDLLIAIVAKHETVIEYFGGTPQNNHQIEETFREYFTGVEIHHLVALLHDRLQVIQQPLLVQDVGLEVWVEALVELLRLHDLPDVDDRESGQSLGQQLAERGLACAWGARHENIGSLGHKAVPKSLSS